MALHMKANGSQKPMPLAMDTMSSANVSYENRSSGIKGEAPRPSINGEIDSLFEITNDIGATFDKLVAQLSPVLSPVLVPSLDFGMQLQEASGNIVTQSQTVERLRDIQNRLVRILDGIHNIQNNAEI